MENELETCAAAFARIKGKDVFTENEFKMEMTLSLKWTSVKETESLIRMLVEKGIMVRNGGFLKVAKDLSSVKVPIAYRPPEDFKKLLSGTVSETLSASNSREQKDLFMEMMDVAVENGIPKGKFVSECNVIKKKLGVDTCVAALLLLRDNGANIEKLKIRVYTQILEK